MELLLSDRTLPPLFPEDEGRRAVDLSRLSIAHCVGCFGCWVKTPGRCVIRDDAVKVYPLIARSTRIIYVSRIRYGSYDVPMKTMLERAIPTQKAFIRLYHGEAHHYQRAVEEKDAVIVAYGARSGREEALFQRLVERNAHNMLFRTWRIRFVAEAEAEDAAREEVNAWDAS